MVKSHSETGALIKEIKGRWFDANWGKTPSFAIQLLGELEDRVDVVNDILSSGRDLRLEFVTGLVREGVSLPDAVAEKLIGELLSKTRDEQSSYDSESRPSDGGVFSFDLLLSLGHLGSARTALESIASDFTASEAVRAMAKERLALAEA